MLFPAHDLGKEHTVIFGRYMECLTDDFIITHIEELTAFQKNVCQHQDDHGHLFLFSDLTHFCQEFFLSFQNTGAVDTGDLCYCQIVPGNMELLIVGE